MESRVNVRRPESFRALLQECVTVQALDNARHSRRKQGLDAPSETRLQQQQRESLMSRLAILRDWARMHAGLAWYDWRWALLQTTRDKLAATVSALRGDAEALRRYGTQLRAVASHEATVSTQRMRKLRALAGEHVGTLITAS